MTVETLSSLVAAFPAPVLVIGPDDLVIEMNEPVVALLGENLAGRHHVSVLRQPGLLSQIDKARATGASRQANFLHLRNGTETRYLVHIANLPAGCLLLTFEDRGEYEGVGRMRSDFVANVSHELRTPLTALVGYIETLQGPAQNDPEAQERFLASMAQVAGRMTRLVDDLLSLSRVEATARVKLTAVVALDVLLRQTVEELDAMLPNLDPHLKFDPTNKDWGITGDAGQLRQLIVNLVENAAKYGGTAGPVDIGLSKTANGNVVLTVKDRGPGIAAHHLPRLTERFYRVDDHRSRDVGGTGLGLAIVKHILQRHGGRLSIRSTPGEGTEVTVQLPVPDKASGAA